MKRQKLWLSWLLSLCMVGTCAVAVACNNGGDSNENSIGGSVSDSPSGDTTPSDTGNGNVGGDVIPDVSIETTADSTDGSSGGDVDDPTPDSTPDSGSDSTPDDSSSDGEGGDLGDDTPEEHVHFAKNWTLAISPTDSSVWQLVGDCETCEETITTVLPAFNESNYYVEEPLCTDEAPKRKYGVYVDGRGALYTEAHEDATLVWVRMEDAPAYHVVYKQGNRYIMNKDKYPMNGRDSYASVIREFEGQESTCTQYGDGFFKCDCCDEFFPVRTYREHESCYTLTRINETEFTLAWECLNDCGEVGSEIVTLRTEENPEGRVIYTRKGDGTCCDPICDYYAVYDEDGRLLAGLEENVEEVPHSVSIHGRSYIMDKEAYPMNGGYASVIREFEDRKSTCTQYGDGVFQCDWCNKFILVRTYREHEFDMSDGWIETEPTCTEDGVLEGRCTLCLERMTMVLPAFGHVIRSAVTTYPTEESFGVMTITCDDCDCVISVNMPELDDGVYVVYEIATDEGTIYAYEWRYAVEIDGHEYEIYAPFEIFVTNIE